MIINNKKIRRMFFKKGVIFLVCILFMFLYMITSSVNAYIREENKKGKIDIYKYYLHNSNNFSS